MPSSVRVRIWPMRAVRDAKQPPARLQDEVLSLVNCYAQDTEVGPLIVGRPGFTFMGAQLGGAGARRGQLVTQFTKRSGTTYTVVICGGKFYTYNWGANAFTEVLTATDFTAAAITLSTTARCYAVTFADLLLISDGVNIPWAWDGTTNGGLTKLTNAPVIYGPPVVYYGKWFGIKNTARSTIVWSEEALINTGFEAGGYNNAWDLVQSRTEGLTALAASNDALYYGRQNSVGAITGAVMTDFKTTGTREAVSDGIGTRSPAAFFIVDNRLVFVDQYGRFQSGGIGGLREIGEGASEVMGAVPADNYEPIQAIDDPETGHIKFAIPESGKDDPTMVIWLERLEGRYSSRETGYEFTRWGVVQDSLGQPTIVHAGGASATTPADGYAYRHGHPLYGSIWTDGLQAGAVAINKQIETGFVGADTYVDKIFSRGEVALILNSNVTDLRVTHVTSQNTSSPLALASLTGSGAVLSAFVLGTDRLASVSEETKRTWTTRQRGRWCKLRLAHGTGSERLGLSELALEYTPVSRRVGVH